MSLPALPRAVRAASVLTLILTAFVTGAPVQAKAAPTSCGSTILTSHKTAALVAPENTIAGINAVPAQGVGWVEMDVQWSSSGFPVLMHDPTVDRTTNGTGSPSTLGLSQLTALSAVDYEPWASDSRYAGEKVPYGWGFMNAVQKNDLNVVLDIHAAPTQVGMDKLVYYIDLWSYRSRVVVMGSAARVQQMRGWYPDLTYAVLEYPPTSRSYVPSYLTSIGASIYAVPVQSLDSLGGQWFVQYMHEAGVRVFVWTSDSEAIDTAASWEKVFVAGADMLITNHPDAALATCDVVS